MDIYKLKFTGLQRDLLEFLFDYPTTKFSERELSRRLNVSPTGISKAIRALEKMGLVKIGKNFMLEVRLNTDNDRSEHMWGIKRVSNLGKIYSSGLFSALFYSLPGRTIILFGSYSHGEDIESSDIDIAVIGASPRNFMLKDIEKFEKALNREINIQFFDWDKTDKNLKESIINGIVLKGHVEL